MLKVFQSDDSDLYLLSYEIPKELSIGESGRQKFWGMAIKSDCNLRSFIYYSINLVKIRILSVEDFDWIANNNRIIRNISRIKIVGAFYFFVYLIIRIFHI